MVQIPPWLYSSFKYLSNDTSYAQIQVQTKKLCHQQVGEEIKSLSRFCRNKVLLLTLSRQNLGLSRQGFVSNSIATEPRFVAIEFCC